MYQCLLAERALHFLYHGSGLRRSLLCFRMLYTYLFNGRAELRWTRHSLGSRRRRSLRNNSRRRWYMSGNNLLARSRPVISLWRLYRTLPKEERIVRCTSESLLPALIEQGLDPARWMLSAQSALFFIIGRLSGTA